MGAQGHDQVTFDSFPGNAEAQVTITGQSGIDASTSAVEAWIRGEASSDHSADEHIIEDMVVQAQDISTGNGFLITARPAVGLCYGRYNVSWVWNG